MRLQDSVVRRALRNSWTRVLEAMGRPVLWMTVALHALTGTMLVLDDRVSQVTGVFLLHQVLGPVTPLLFIAAAVMGFRALERMKNGVTVTSILWLVPSQALLMAGAASIFIAIFQGHYASGTVLPRAFIFTDQSIKLLLAAFHPMCLFRLAHELVPREVLDGRGE